MSLVLESNVHIMPMENHLKHIGIEIHLDLSLMKKYKYTWIMTLSLSSPPPNSESMTKWFVKKIGILKSFPF